MALLHIGTLQSGTRYEMLVSHNGGISMGGHQWLKKKTLIGAILVINGF
jgi:hypothetical protein